VCLPPDTCPDRNSFYKALHIIPLDVGSTIAFLSIVQIRIRIPGRIRIPKTLSKPWVKGLTVGLVVLSMLGSAALAYAYVRYGKIVDARLRDPMFSNTARIYAAPQVIRVAQRIGPKEIAAALRQASYTSPGDHTESPMGTYRLHASSLEIMPGAESYHSPGRVRVSFSESQIEKITSLAEPVKGDLDRYELEPQLVTGLYEQAQRSKRRLVTYDDVPRSLREAILAIEDRRFFDHSGVNYLRLAKAALTDLRTGQNLHGGGASTLTMQLAKGFFLTAEKTPQRKIAQILIALQLERRLSKKQIFEDYVNWTPMGQRGSFEIAGMGEAAQSYFGKDIKNLELPESALLAGIVQRPSSLNPFRHPDLALKRRNLVLDAMTKTGAISREEAERAKAAPLKLAAHATDSGDAPYFVDMVREALLSDYDEEQLNRNGMRIYTSLEPALQRAAAEAVQAGTKQIDELIRRQRTRKVKIGEGKNARTEIQVLPGPQAQVAIIAMDPHTGRVLALSGGRNYGLSQLNHALAARPTGSIFKPLVYAAALNSALGGAPPIYTQSTLIDDSGSAFPFGNKVYTPKNFHDVYHGQVTAQFALAHSLNNATVKLAEMVGYDRVAELARSVGIDSVKPTPAIALGAYDATPMEMARAYTAFANGGALVSPAMITSIRDAQGNVLQNFAAEKKSVLDPRVAYLVTNMMEAVVNNDGTGAGVRRLGFTAPAAGKTGTSHDGWFAGYTSNLLCIVWVGFDDYSDLKLEGAHSAAPIWGMFMKKAATLPGYQDPKLFTPPPGIVTVKLDKLSNLVSTTECPDSYEAAFIEGSEPKETCNHGAPR
jgi:penicillin-binding protein 1B